MEGDSGPYIQYAVVRINSIVKKTEGLLMSEGKKELSDEARNLNRTLWRYHNICFKAVDEFAPQYVAQYLIDLASRFNTFYNKNKIIEDEKVNKELLDLCVKTRDILTQGLTVLGIRVVPKM